LQILSSTITYLTLPDLELFLNDIERGQANREQFRNALDKHSQTFAGFSKTADLPTTAIVVDKALLSDVSEYVEETLVLEAGVTGNIALIPPNLDKAAAEESKKKILDIYEWIQSNIKGLEHVADALNEMTQFHEQKILHEIELASEAFEDEIDRIETDVEKKVELLLKERDAKIEKINKTEDRELKTRLQEKERHQRELEKLELKKAEYREKLEARRSRRNKIGVTRWEHRLRTCENRISAVRQQIYNFSEYIESIQRRNQEEVNKLKYDYQALIDSERKKITEIKVTQESVIKAKENENKQLQLSTSHIVDLIKQLREQKMLHATELVSLTIPWQPEQTSLLGVPFYLVGYKTGGKYLYGVYPPLRAMSPEGIVKKIKKTLLSFRLRSRIKLLLQPRSKALSKMFSLVVEEKMKTDRNFKEKLRELGASNNLLSNSKFKEELNEGLEELRTEGWIKPEEGAIIRKTYA
jgi:DNA repair exonuclease SbcCD ATPase subunit